MQVISVGRNGCLALTALVVGATKKLLGRVPEPMRDVDNPRVSRNQSQRECECEQCPATQTHNNGRRFCIKT